MNIVPIDNAHLEALLARCTPGDWSYDDGVTSLPGEVVERGKPQAVYATDGAWVGEPTHEGFEDADGALMSASKRLASEVMCLRSENALLRAAKDELDVIVSRPVARKMRPLEEIRVLRSTLMRIARRVGGDCGNPDEPDTGASSRFLMALADEVHLFASKLERMG